MNREKYNLRDQARTIGDDAVRLLADTCRGAPLGEMPQELAYWYMRYLRHGLAEVMAGNVTDVDERTALEDECVRVAILPPRPDPSASRLILPN